MSLLRVLLFVAIAIVACEAWTCEFDKYLRRAHNRHHRRHHQRGDAWRRLSPKIHVSRQKLNWYQGYNYCNQHRGHLIALQNLNEVRKARRLLKSRRGFLGMHRVSKTGPFVTIMWAKYFKHWSSRQPDNWHKSEGCVELYRNGRYNDINCHSRFHAVCRVY